MDLPWGRIRGARGLADLSSMGAANAGGNAISGAFWLYVATLLGPEKYGEVGYFISVASIAAVFCMFGSGHVLTVYAAKGQNQAWSAAVIGAGSSVVGAAALYLMFAEPSMTVYMAGYVVFILGGSALLGMKSYKKYSVMIALQKVCLVAFAIPLYYLMGYTGIVVGAGVSMLILTWPVIKLLSETERSFAGFRERFSFSAFSYARTVVMAVNGQIDKLVVASVLGFTELGGYHLGFQITGVLMIIPTIVFQYVLPQDASGNPNPTLKKATIAVAALMTVLGVTLAPVAVPAFFPEYGDSVLVVQIASLAIVIQTITTIRSSSFLAAENSKITLVSTLLSIATMLPMMYLLGSAYGLAGMAASIVAASLAAMSVFVIKNRFMEIDSK
ncbi:putative Polysaccharide biosynthesis protein [Nitrosopumilaceae archaeon]|nr:oligosaccharide flippase family protein [Nitrosopumilus sp.]MDA7997091.1 oligosaccharide flippase family protein [Nitrosopumilus sp.]CAI9832042.1 putative Polysaccharide biosynthesis protein [Nitrosopumilaceae archaeon]